MFPERMYAGTFAREGCAIRTGWGSGKGEATVSGGAITSLKWYLAASASVSKVGGCGNEGGSLPLPLPLTTVLVVVVVVPFAKVVVVVVVVGFAGGGVGST